MIAHQLKRGGGILGTSGGVLDASDVFSTYLYTGNGSTQTIVNGIDLAGQGGMVWLKCRNNAFNNYLCDTTRGITNYLSSNTTGTQNFAATVTDMIASVNSNGFTLGSGTTLNGTNNSGQTHSSWTFREAPKFFHQVTKVHTNGVASTVDLTTLGTAGMVVVKSTVGTSNWFTWHRSLTAGNNLKLNLTDAESATNAYLSVSGTTLTIASTAPSDTYIVYAWAHDTGTDGIIQCGSFTTTVAGDYEITLGWEPQFNITKRSIGGVSSWWMLDSMRGMPVGGNDAYLEVNTASSELNSFNQIEPTATGFKLLGLSASSTYIYMAIRRPNKVLTSGTEVYNAIARTGTGAVATVSGVGFAPDLTIIRAKDTAGTQSVWYDRLRGKDMYLVSSSTSIEQTATNSVTEFQNNGVLLGSDSAVGQVNTSGLVYINHFFKRAKEFFDVVCYTGTGTTPITINHSLGVVPDFIITKCRSLTGTWWMVYHASLGANKYLALQSTAAVGSASVYPSAPTITNFYVDGSFNDVGAASATYVSYLFATLAGVSKVGSYTGNGTSQTINCGFSTGARFILSKAVSTTGNWNIGDSTRGIVAGTDPLLCLNTTAAEVTTDDWLDPENTGFIVNETASAHANTNGVQYVFLAIA